MPADPINLRRARKIKDRAQREQDAAEKRRQFGRTKTEKQIEAANRDRAERKIDGHRLQKD